MHLNLENMLQDAAQEIFGTMLNMKVVFDSPRKPIEQEPFVAGTVGFTGQFNGLICLYTSALFGRKMTGCLLGLSDHEIQDRGMIQDAMGELTNMHAGHLKSRLCDWGYPCVMTIPSVVMGRDFQIVSVSGAQRFTVCARAGGSDLVLLELIAKSNGTA